MSRRPPGALWPAVGPDFRRRLSELRRLAGLSQSGLAARIGCSQGAVSSLEAGGDRFRLCADDVLMIAGALRVSPGQLFGLGFSPPAAAGAFVVSIESRAVRHGLRVETSDDITDSALDALALARLDRPVHSLLRSKT